MCGWFVSWKPGMRLTLGLVDLHLQHLKEREQFEFFLMVDKFAALACWMSWESLLYGFRQLWNFLGLLFVTNSNFAIPRQTLVTTPGLFFLSQVFAFQGYNRDLPLSEFLSEVFTSLKLEKVGLQGVEKERKKERKRNRRMPRWLTAFSLHDKNLL